MSEEGKSMSERMKEVKLSRAQQLVAATQMACELTEWWGIDSLLLLIQWQLCEYLINIHVVFDKRVCMNAMNAYLEAKRTQMTRLSRPMPPDISGQVVRTYMANIQAKKPLCEGGCGGGGIDKETYRACQTCGGTGVKATDTVAPADTQRQNPGYRPGFHPPNRTLPPKR